MKQPRILRSMPDCKLYIFEMCKNTIAFSDCIDAVKIIEIVWL